jgi:hypothetical protein
VIGACPAPERGGRGHCECWWDAKTPCCACGDDSCLPPGQREVPREIAAKDLAAFDTASVAAHSHGMGQESAIADVIKWLDFLRRKATPMRAAYAEKLCARLRDGSWRKDL